jgi:hypothetical protein
MVQLQDTCALKVLPLILTKMFIGTCARTGYSQALLVWSHIASVGGNYGFIMHVFISVVLSFQFHDFDSA